jgi:hypothetical protein
MNRIYFKTTLLILFLLLVLKFNLYCQDEVLEFYIYPNPVSPEDNISAYIEIQGTEASYEMDLKLYDIKLNLVKEYASGRNITNGPHILRLGSIKTNKDGIDIEEGIYIFYLKITGQDINEEKLYRISYVFEEK